MDSPPASWDSEEEEEPVRKGKLDLASNSLKASTGPSSSRRSSVAIDPKEPERLSLSTLLADEEDLPIAPSLSDLSLDPLSKNAMSLQEDPLLSRRVASNSSPVQLRSLASSISSGSPAPPPGLALRPVESEGPPENIQWVYTDPSGKVQGLSTRRGRRDQLLIKLLQGLSWVVRCMAGTPAATSLAILWSKSCGPVVPSSP